MKLGVREEADSLFQTMLQTYNQVEEEDFLKSIYGNYSWNQLIQKNYSFAIDLVNKALAYNSKFPDLYITLAYSNYQLGQPEDALDAIAAFRRQNRKDPRSKMVLKFLEVLENFLLGRKKTFERLASQLLLQLEKWRDLEVDLFVYQMLIDHYTGMEDEHSLCVVQAKLIDFLMH